MGWTKAMDITVGTRILNSRNIHPDEVTQIISDDGETSINLVLKNTQTGAISTHRVFKIDQILTCPITPEATTPD